MPSFDIVSRTELAEVDNALENIRREIATRFDFKGSKSTLTRDDVTITILADDDTKLAQIEDMLRVHMTRRKIETSALDFKPAEKAGGDMRRQLVLVKQGIAADLAKQIVKDLKASKLKVQAQIQGDELRITGKSRDDLQSAIAFVKSLKIDQPLQFQNFRD